MLLMSERPGEGEREIRNLQLLGMAMKTLPDQGAHDTNAHSKSPVIPAFIASCPKA